MIDFNKPYLAGKELEYIRQAVESGKISGDGLFTDRCHDFFKRKYGFQKPLLTTSCTDALEMAALLLNISPGDEVIAPAYTFVSTVNAFVLRGAKIVFADSTKEHPNIDANNIEQLITSRTRVILPVHYAGVGCDMDKISKIVENRPIALVEDCAQAIDSYYKEKPLGVFGVLSAFSFHETKNVISGEGGMLVVNDPALHQRAEIIREKGTNRSAFFRGEVDKYGWVDIGSSFLPSDIISAFLYAQLENLKVIQDKRMRIWNWYHELLKDLEINGKLELPHIPGYARHNAHMYYVVCKNLQERTDLIRFLREQGIYAVFHYLSLHKSPYYFNHSGHLHLPNADRFSECLVRLPFYFDLERDMVEQVSQAIHAFFLK